MTIQFESDDEARAWDRYAAACVSLTVELARASAGLAAESASELADAMLLERRRRFRCGLPVLVSDRHATDERPCRLGHGHAGECCS